MFSEGDSTYFLLALVNPIILMYMELFLCSLLLFSECCKIFLLLKFENNNMPHLIYKSKIDIWRKVEIGAIVCILFLQMLDMNIFTPFFALILGHEFYYRRVREIEDTLIREIQLKKMEFFVKFIFYLMTVYFFTVKILLKKY
ncbi:uncharacterized protein VNE69_01227 [Vairimorpha necatrix]|uniref:Membrane protein n=1 Tax=Vairimorpha necatrix TaxID=6039 RepID=A0AAX4J8J7_9MICR